MLTLLFLSPFLKLYLDHGLRSELLETRKNGVRHLADWELPWIMRRETGRAVNSRLRKKSRYRFSCLCTEVQSNQRGWEILVIITSPSPGLNFPSPDSHAPSNQLSVAIPHSSRRSSGQNPSKTRLSFSRSRRVNFQRMPTTHFALANQKPPPFRDETRSDPS
jgi:hypothetical protein